MLVRARSIGFGGRFPHVFQDLPELYREHDGGGAHGQGVCHRFCQKYRHHFICKEMGQNEDQRDEQDDLSQDSQKQGSFGVAQRHKGLLAGDLCTEDETHGHVDPQRPDREGGELRVGGEDGREDLGAEHGNGPQQGGISQAGSQQEEKGFFHPVGVAGAIVEADDGLGALT